MANTQKLKSLIADWESTSDDIPFGLDEDDRVILEAMKFAADNHDIAARLEAAEATIKQQDELITSYQQTIMKHIDTLAELEKQEESRWNTHDGIARPIGVDKDDLVYLRMKRQEIKLPYPAGMVNWKHDGSDFDVVAWADTNMPCRPAPPAPLLKCSTHTSAPPVTERASPFVVKLPPEADGSNLPFVAMAWNAFRKEVIEAIKAAGGEVVE